MSNPNTETPGAVVNGGLGVELHFAGSDLPELVASAKHSDIVAGVVASDGPVSVESGSDLNLGALVPPALVIGGVAAVIARRHHKKHEAKQAAKLAEKWAAPNPSTINTPATPAQQPNLPPPQLNP